MSSDMPLSGSARERLAAARALAGLPADRALAAAPGDAVTWPPASQRRWWPLAVIAVAALCVAGGWWLVRRDDGLVADTRQIQQRVLAGGVRGRELQRAVDAIIRNVDQMSRDQQKEAREALDTDWRQAYEAGVAAYFDAAEEGRQSLLDEAIDRTLAFRQLRYGLNPQASGPYAGRMRRGRGRDRDRNRQEGEDEAAAAARRKLAEQYATAVKERAKERKIDLPEWQ
ncbi:MAG: hypothetical protein EBR86_09320 [Planctomycetia bacterium]|nr:hypothetical protein [Planctomycetia bacterium]